MKYIKTYHLQMCDFISASRIVKSAANEFSFTVNINVQGNMPLRGLKRSHCRVGIFVDTNCHSSLEFLKLASTENMFGKNYEWLLWLGDGEIRTLADTGIAVNSEVTAAVGSHIYDIYRNDVNSDFIISRVGNWTNENGLLYRREPKMIDFNKMPVYGGIFFLRDVFNRQNLTSQLQDWSYYSSYDTVNRYFYCLNLHIADLYNYTLKLVETDGWGDLLPDGHYSGLLGQLEGQVTNMSVGPLLMLPARTKFTDFSMPIMKYWFSFVFRQPRTLGTYRALYLPLKPMTWLATALVVLLAVLIFHKVHLSTVHTQDEAELSASLVQFIGILSQQGLTIDPRAFHGRFICLTMLIMSMIVMFHYNASTMTALLSTSPPKIRELHQLVASDIPLTLMDAPYFNNKKTRMRVLDAATIAKVDKYSQRFYSLEEGLEIVLKGGAFSAEFFIIYEGIKKKFHDSQKCDLTYIPSLRQFLLISLLPKNSPLREIHTRGFIRLMEHGLSEREKVKWIVSKPKCTSQEQFLFVSLEAITVALTALLFGFTASLFTLLSEVIKHRRVRKSQRNKRIKMKQVRPKLSSASDFNFE